MKFTKENAYKELVARLTANGEKLNLSERSINEQLETLMPLIGNEEMELNDFVEKTLPLFKTSNANVRNDVSKEINKYKEEHKVEETKPIETPQDQKNDNPLEQRLAELELEIKNQRLEKTANEKRNAIREYLKGKGVKNEDFIKGMLAELSITEDLDVETKGEDLLTLYNKIVANDTPSDTTPKDVRGRENKDYAVGTIEQAAAMVKQNTLV